MVNYPGQRHVERVGIHDVDCVSMFCLTCGLGVNLILDGVVGSGHWTGRKAHAGPPIDVLRWRVRAWLWPSYECELCVGQEPWRGCWCAYHGAPRPNEGPSRSRVWARELATRWLGVEG